ncbi:MAG: hypothetical protein RL026_197 [Pseudomonadota bacterium]
MNHSTARKARILVVDDDPGLLRLLTIRLRAEGHDVEAVEGGPQALAAASRFRPDLVITDLRMEPMDGIGLLKELQQRWPGLKVIMLTAHGTIPDAVQATQRGAFGFLTKPVEKQELLEQIQRALRISGFSDQTAEWRSGIVSRSAIMEERLSQAHMTAATDAQVLVTGEGGTGRKLLAEAIHKASARRHKPFGVVSCVAGSEDELDSELFGHAAGALPGAEDAQRGAFERNDGGTVLLADIDELPARLQQKLLRCLQERVVRPLGGGPPVAVDVRVISSGPPDLPQRVALGEFRDDLLYRLNMVQIELPTLARRREDIPVLVAHFLAQTAAAGQGQHSYAPEALELLSAAEWPGNVRQLQNLVHQNVAMAQTPVMPPELVQQSLGSAAGRLQSYDEAREDFTRSYLSQLLQVTAGNVSQAARLARRNRTDFYKLLGRHQLVPDDFKSRQGR